MKDPAAYKQELEREMNDPRNAHDYPHQEHLLRLWKMAHRLETRRAK